MLWARKFYMPKAVLVGALALLAPVRPSSAAVDPGNILQPVTVWDLDYAEAQCAAYRNYGDAAKATTLVIRPSPNGETYEILVARQSYGPQFAQELKGSVDFGSGPIKAWLLNYRTQQKHLDVYQFRIPAAEMARARSSTSLKLRIDEAPDFAFSLESMPQLLDGLSACTSDLERYWNMGGEKDGLIASPAKADVRSLFSADDYPAEALSRHQEGRGQFLLLIDENGKVAGCHVLVATGVPALDAMGCAVIQERGRFKPALDARGKPVRSTYVTPPIQWRIR
jgi:TonB family protein